MSIIKRNRTIRPSTRQVSSISYKIDTRKVCKEDTLIVNINHEDGYFKGTYKFKGEDVADLNSIHFVVDSNTDTINVRWSGAQPFEINK